jgi:hypothetical protein
MPTSANLATPATIWTIGHSTRALDEFVGLLAGSHIESIVDVRSFPGSRKYPQYGREALAATLAAHAIGYHWLPALGGRRRALPDSPNTAWRNASFRGYADYMAGTQFAQGLVQLLEWARKSRTAMMCGRSAVVALPSLDDRRRAVRAWHRGRAHPRCRTPCHASDDITRSDCAGRVELCRSAARISLRANANARLEVPWDAAERSAPAHSGNFSARSIAW